MSVVVRRYRPEDREGFGRVRSRVYRADRPVGPDEELLPPDTHGIVAELNGEIVAALTAIDMTCSHPRANFRSAGIAAVGVIPEFRQTGVGSALMREALPILKELGFAVASLYPFSEAWYRRFGFATAGRRLQIEAPAHRMPGLRPELTVRNLPASEFAELKPVEAAMAARYVGYSVRQDAQWVRALGGSTPLTVFAAGDPVEAYAVIRLRDDFWGIQEVKEFAWSTEAGYRSILALMASLTLNHNGIRWPEPGDSPFVDRYLDQGVTATLFRPIMFQVLDFAAFGEPEPADPGSATLRLLGDPLRVYCADFF